MGKLHAESNWSITVFKNEHPPVHVHVIHPDGKALVYLDGRTLNSRIPAATLKAVVEWVAAHEDEIRAEWARLHNPEDRRETP